MTKSRQQPLLLLQLVLLTCLSSTPALADVETTLNLYVNGGYYWFDGDRLDGTPLEGFEPEDSAGGGGGFDYMITDRWGMGGAVEKFSVRVKDIDEHVDVYNYHLDLFYQFAGLFCGNLCWQPYVAFGAGEIRINDDHSTVTFDDWHKRQTMVNLGLGIKYQLGPRWQARADARAFQGVEHGGVDGFVSVAIGYQWREYPTVVYDLDGDGVFDDMDRCPQTPPGVLVGGDGCPVDTDYDGVPNYLDQCPNTPMGVAVDEYGCPS